MKQIVQVVRNTIFCMLFYTVATLAGISFVIYFSSVDNWSDVANMFIANSGLAVIIYLASILILSFGYSTSMIKDN